MARLSFLKLLSILFAPVIFLSHYSASALPNATVDTIMLSETHLPVLTGRQKNVLMQIRVVAKEPVTLNSIKISLRGTTRLSDISAIAVYTTDGIEKYSAEGREFSRVLHPGKELTLTGNLELNPGVSNLWVTVSVIDKAVLTNRIFLDCTGFTFKGQAIVKPLPHIPFTGARLGLSLRTKGDDQVDTYRIPGLATTSKGTLIAVYDVRYLNSRDLQGHVDIGMSRSTDGGNSWEPMKIILDKGESGGLPQDQNGVGDPAILVDQETGTIWVAAVWAHGKPGKPTWTASQPGLDSTETGQLLLIRSDDDGKTWSPPINITSQVKDPKWYLFLQGPGKGITMKNGTLVFAAQYKDENQMPHSTIIYSTDHGTTWKSGTPSKSNTTEAQVVQLADGSLMLNMRDNRGKSRSVSVTHDLGLTWTEHPSSRSALTEPVCMGSLDWFTFKKPGRPEKKILLFSNPDSDTQRINIKLKLSFDEGRSWPTGYQVLLDAGRSAGYSCLTQIDDNTVGILYESSQANLVFQKINLREIIKKIP